MNSYSSLLLLLAMLLLLLAMTLMVVCVAVLHRPYHLDIVQNVALATTVAGKEPACVWAFAVVAVPQRGTDCHLFSICATVYIDSTDPRIDPYLHRGRTVLDK